MWHRSPRLCVFRCSGSIPNTNEQPGAAVPYFFNGLLWAPLDGRLVVPEQEQKLNASAEGVLNSPAKPEVCRLGGCTGSLDRR